MRAWVSFYVPTLETINDSQMTSFVRFCEVQTDLSFPDAQSFHQFTVEDFRRFWSLFLRWSGLLYEGSLEPVCAGDDCERATFFPEVRLSYAENLLRIDGDRDGAKPALTAIDPSGRRTQLSRRELRDRVIRFSRALESLGVKHGDRLVAVRKQRRAGRNHRARRLGDRSRRFDVLTRHGVVFDVGKVPPNRPLGSPLPHPRSLPERRRDSRRPYP